MDNMTCVDVQTCQIIAPECKILPACDGLFSYAAPSFPDVNYGSFLSNGPGYEMVFSGDNFGPTDTAASVYLTYGTGTTQQTCDNAKAINHTALQCELN
eukprot:scaffold216011_cov46-Prasinocladus_malaysianus.AAC.2